MWGISFTKHSEDKTLLEIFTNSPQLYVRLYHYSRIRIKSRWYANHNCPTIKGKVLGNRPELHAKPVGADMFANDGKKVPEGPLERMGI